MAKTLATAGRNGACDGVVDLLDAGKVNIYEGATLLATIPFGNPAFGDSAVGVATANAFTAGTAVASGAADSAKILKSDDTEVLTGLTVTATGGGGDIELDVTVIVAGDSVNITGGAKTITMPAT